MIGSLICSSVSAQDTATPPADIDVEFVMENHEGGKKGGSVIHSRSTKGLADAPLVNTITGLDGSSAVVTISYVGYVRFQVAKKAKNDQLKSGHVFAVQVFSGKKGVTLETAEKNVTKLLVYQKSPQILYEDDNITVTVRNKE